MKSFRWIRVILAIIFSFVAVYNFTLGQQKESKIRIKHITTIMNQDVDYDVFPTSIGICKNYLMLNLTDGPEIIDYVGGKKLKKINKLIGEGIGITTFTYDCRYVLIEDRRKSVDVFEEYRYFCSDIVDIYIYDIAKNNTLGPIKACQDYYGFSPDGKKLAITIPSKYINKNLTTLPFELIQLDFGRFAGWLDDRTIVIKRKKDYKPLLYYIDSKQTKEDEKLKIIRGVDKIYNYKNLTIIRNSYKSKDGKYKVSYYDYKTLNKLFEYYENDVFISEFIPDSFILYIRREPKFILPTDAEVDDKILVVDLRQAIRKPIQFN